jgi:hypothetical protein
MERDNDALKNMRTSYSGWRNADERRAQDLYSRGDKSDSGREFDIKTILKMRGYYTFMQHHPREAHPRSFTRRLNTQGVHLRLNTNCEDRVCQITLLRLKKFKIGKIVSIGLKFVLLRKQKYDLSNNFNFILC